MLGAGLNNEALTLMKTSKFLTATAASLLAFVPLGAAFA
jgi:hypothetical protein